jgi:hypothetical protein
VSYSRSKNISVDDIEAIVGILDGWKGALTWNALISCIELRMYSKYTRQALSGHDRIAQAFQQRKKNLKERPSERSNQKSSEFRVLQERLDRKDGEILRLRSENQRLIEQFVVWLYNAHLHGLTPEDLNRALPPTNRGQTKVELRSV